jgi:hypothetical protein
MSFMAASTAPTTLAYVLAGLSILGTVVTTTGVWLWLRARQRPIFQTTIRIVTPKGGQIELAVDPLASDEEVAQRVIEALKKSRSRTK